MLEKPACFNPGHYGVAAFVLYKQPLRAFQEHLHPPTHMALIGNSFFFLILIPVTCFELLLFSPPCVYIDRQIFMSPVCVPC